MLIIAAKLPFSKASPDTLASVVYSGHTRAHKTWPGHDPSLP